MKKELSVTLKDIEKMTPNKVDELVSKKTKEILVNIQNCTNKIQEAKEAAEEIGYPVIIRPAFTLGGAGGGVAYDADTLAKIISDYGARIIDNTGGCFVVELSDTPHKIDDFLDEVKDLELVEMCRSGAIAMERGSVAYDI